MILDKMNLFDDNVVLTNSRASTDIIDLSQVRDVGAGEALELVVNVNSALLSAGASTFSVSLQTDTQSSFATAVTLVGSPLLIPKATAIAGYQPLKQKLPEGVQRYLRLLWVVSTADFTGGTVTAGLNIDKRQHAAYASGLNVSGF